MPIPEGNVCSTGRTVLSLKWPLFDADIPRNTTEELEDETITKPDINITTDTSKCLGPLRLSRTMGICKPRKKNRIEEKKLPLSKRSPSKCMFVPWLFFSMFFAVLSISTAAEPFTNCTFENTVCINREDMRHLSNGGVIIRDTGQMRMRILMEHGRLVFNMTLRNDQRSANSFSDGGNNEPNENETSDVSEATQVSHSNTMNNPTTVPAPDSLAVSEQIHNRSVINGNINEVGPEDYLQDEQRGDETEGSLVPIHELAISNRPFSFQNQHLVNGPALNYNVTESSEECQRNFSSNVHGELVISGKRLADTDHTQSATLDTCPGVSEEEYHRRPSDSSMVPHHQMLISGRRESRELQVQDNNRSYLDNDELSIDDKLNILGIQSGRSESQNMEWHDMNQHHHRMLISGRRESCALQVQDIYQRYVDNAELSIQDPSNTRCIPSGRSKSHDMDQHDRMLVSGRRESHAIHVQDYNQHYMDDELPIEDTSNSRGILVITGQSSPDDERECDAGAGPLIGDQTRTAVSLYHPTDESNEGFNGQHGELVVTDRYRQPVTITDTHQLLVTNRSPGMDPYCPANRATTLAEIAVSGQSQSPNPMISVVYRNPLLRDNSNAPIARHENGSDIGGVDMD
ncbi:uncharacterized protein LOC117344345 [Pecten maximus]|uniref:uncharacterized protein LOC117344345 n=1 Tax=Pecten maximus TaxID=6579 RepID=UPI001458F92B|nr:uncharacterized protein LOC117344345 [Pecten maximus]